MTKTYKINGKEIERVERLDDEEYSVRHSTLKIKELVIGFNLLLEALSDKEEYIDGIPVKDWSLAKEEIRKAKQEECKRCTDKLNINLQHTCALGTTSGEIGTKQPTSLKEEIIETIWMAHGQSAVVPNTADKILSLIQSHLVKEIENLTQETVLDDLKREFPVLYKQDIIKIINNI